MALVKFGGGITAMSGSIAGNTFARNRSGAYIRSRTKPVNPNTDAQSKIRGIIAYLTEVWSDILTVAQRASWNLYASNVTMKNKLGEAIKLTGFNHYIRSNSTRLYHNRFVVNDGPVEFTLPEKDGTLTIDVDDTPQLITVTFNDNLAWNTENGGKMMIQQGVPQNAQRNFYAGPWHQIRVYDGAAGDGVASPHGIAVLKYVVATGQKQWCRFRISRADGRLSEPWIVSALVHGHAPGEVPNVIGMTQDVATAAIIAAQLVLGNVTEANSETIPVSCVISSDPVAHTRLNVGDPVNIVVSLGPSA